MMQINKYKSLYFRGCYQEVIDSSSKEGMTNLDQKSRAYVLGAYLMLGLMEEARTLYYHRFSDHDAALIANFFWALALMRRSEYQEAAEIFSKNFWLAKKSKDHQFYFYQGMAFYRYYCGDFVSALNHANRSLNASQKENQVFEQVYVLEMMGHLYVQMGFFYRGLEIFSRSLKLARQNDCEGLVNSIESTILGYEMVAGMNLDENILEVKKRLKEAPPEEFYLNAQLRLQLAKAHFLRGSLSQMEEELNQAAFYIYRTSNKRQAHLLNISLAYLDYVKGNYDRALFHLNNGRQGLKNGIDNHFEIKMLGLEVRILDHLKRDEISKPLYERLEELETKYRPYLNMVLKSRWKYAERPGNCSDPIFLLTRTQDMSSPPNKEFIETLSEKKLLGVMHLFERSHFPNRLHFGIRSKAILLQLDGEIIWTTKRLTRRQHDFVKLIAERKSVTKAEVIETLWNYHYDSFIHDALIYNTISKIRKWNPLLAKAILIDRDIQLRSDIEVVGLRDAPRTIKIIEKKRHQKLSHELNFRQMRLIDELKAGKWISPREYQDFFDVSRITATRDLRELMQMGILKSKGKTRSIYYGLIKS